MALAGAGMGSVQAATVDYTVALTNGNFEASGTGVPGWTPGGTANVRPQIDDINTKGGVVFSGGDQYDVFDQSLASNDTGFFSSGKFAVLGDSSGKITGILSSSSSPNSGSSSISQSFTLPGTFNDQTVSAYDLILHFKSAFDGDANTTDQDKFTVLLTSASGTTTLLMDMFSGAQIKHDSASLMLSGLLPGAYTLAFQLSESTGGNRSTAVGIDNVTLAGTLTTVPVPPAVWLLGSALAGFAVIGRRKDV